MFTQENSRTSVNLTISELLLLLLVKVKCIHYVFSPTRYVDEEISGMPHSRHFTVSCNVAGRKFASSATTKKQAKDAAAEAAYNVIKNVTGSMPLSNSGLSSGPNSVGALIHICRERDLPKPE